MHTAVVVLLAFKFLELTTPDGRAIEVNPSEIITLRHPRETSDRIVHEDTNCLLFTTDGKFVAVKETCKEVRDLIEGFKRGNE